MTSTIPVADFLFAARRDARPIAMDADVATLDLAEAYAIQDRLVALGIAAGARVVGWKIGLTSSAAMAAFGASEPIVGRLFEEYLLTSGALLDLARTCDAKVEGEVLIELREVPSPPFDDERILSAIASVRPAIEIADSRIVGWPKNAALAIADDACCGWVIVGEPRQLAGLDLANVEMRFTVDGVEVGRGTGADCLGSPINVLRWFLSKAVEMDWRIQPGHLILTGAIASPVHADCGIHHRASLTMLGPVEFALSENQFVRR